MKKTFISILFLAFACSICSFVAYRVGYTRATQANPEASSQSSEGFERQKTSLNKSSEENFPAPLPGIEATTAKEIETFGRDMLGQRRQMLCTFYEVSDQWVRLWFPASNYVGFFIKDEKGDLFQFCFADKTKHGRNLLKLKKGTKLRLNGKVDREGKNFVFFVDDIAE